MVMPVVISRYWNKKEARMYQGFTVLDKTKRKDMIENVLVMSQILPKLFYDKSPKKTRQSEESKELINKRAPLVFLMNYILCGMISNIIRKCNNNL